MLLFILPPLMLPFMERMFEFDMPDILEFVMFEFDMPDMFEFDMPEPDMFEFIMFEFIVDIELVFIVEDAPEFVVDIELVLLIFPLVMFALSVAVHPAQRLATASKATSAKVRRIEFPPVPFDGSDCWGAEEAHFPPQLDVKGFINESSAAYSA
ncbi:MAG: hypothetical protein M3430_02260 [Acidobacteriota bacterium]|nr:hypothetical protein [Acidobacteriota bacterium]